MMTSTIWIIDDDQSIRWVLERAFRGSEIETVCFSNAEDALNALQYDTLPNAIISDIRMPGLDGLSFMQKMHAEHPHIPVIIITAHSDLDSAVSAYEGGAFEYLPKPFDIDEVIEQVKRACHTSQQGTVESDDTLAHDTMPELIGEAPAMQEVFRAIGRLSRSNITVLINGESGSGKELIAQALHRHSPRADQPFVALNMAAIPHDLMESELFGHEKGAFTGAQSQRQGRFEQAHGGTLFLDEIGDMPADLQTRLLRVLSDGHFYRVGGRTAIKADVRIVAATHQHLETLVAEKRFREDLFHRLNVIRIHAPALRERREDIPLLLHHFLIGAAHELEVEVKTPTPALVKHLSQLDWPGNVRQLENLSRWLTVMASGHEILIDDLPSELNEPDAIANMPAQEWEHALESWANKMISQGKVDLLSVATPVFEKVMIRCALSHTDDHRQEAAKLLGWGRNTLTRKIKELEMDA